MMEPGQKATLYRVLSVVWCFPSLGALYLLVVGALRWPWGRGWLEVLSSVRLEEWIAVGLLLIHGLWIWLGRRG